MQNVTLPEYLEDHAHHYAETNCDIMGIGEDDNNYKKHYRAFFQEFCMEAYSYSLTPSGELKSNPTTNKVSPYIYKKLDIRDKLANLSIESSDKELDYLESQFKGAMMSMVNVILKLRFGMKVKGDDSDFTYKPRLGFYGEGDEDDLIQVEVNRYIRLGVLASLFATLENFLDKSFDMKKHFLDNLPKKEMGDSGIKDFDLKTLRLKKNREAYVKDRYDEYKR